MSVQKTKSDSGGGRRRRRSEKLNGDGNAAHVSAATTGSSSEAFGSGGRPSRAELNSKVDALALEMDAMKITEKSLKAEIDKILGTKTNNKPEVESARTALQVLFAQRTVLTKERAAIIADCEAARKILNDHLETEKTLRGDIRFKDAASISTAIKELEDRQARTSLSLGEEKRLMAEIKALKQSKKSVQDLEVLLVAVKADKERLKVLDDKFAVKKKELAALNEKIDAEKAVLDKAGAETDHVRSNLPKLRDQVSSLRDDIAAKYEKMKELRADFKAREDSWQEKAAAEKKRREDEAKAIKEQRRAEEERRRAEEKALEDARPPYDHEINLCDELTGYLMSMIGSSLKATAVFSDVQQAKVSSPPMSPELKPFSRGDAGGGSSSDLVFTKRPDDTYFQLKTKDAKSKKDSSAATKNATAKSQKITLSFLAHSAAILKSFELLGLHPPALDTEIPQVVELLKEKKVFYQSQERGAVPTIAEKEASRARKTLSSSGPDSISSEISPSSVEGSVEKAEVAAPAIKTKGAARPKGCKADHGGVTVFSLAADFPPLGGPGSGGSSSSSI